MIGPYTKKEDWITQLAAELSDSHDRPFDWGQNDCMQYVGRCVEAMTGTNPMTGLLVPYNSPHSAFRALRKHEGIVLPIDMADRLWGPRVPIAFARMGDIVAVDLGQPAAMGPSLGICYGRNSLFVGTRMVDSGLVRLDTLTLEHCYQPWVLSSKP